MQNDMGVLTRCTHAQRQVTLSFRLISFLSSFRGISATKYSWALASGQLYFSCVFVVLGKTDWQRRLFALRPMWNTNKLLWNINLLEMHCMEWFIQIQYFTDKNLLICSLRIKLCYSIMLEYNIKANYLSLGGEIYCLYNIKLEFSHWGPWTKRKRKKISLWKAWCK